MEGKQTIEVKDDQERPSNIVGKYSRVPNGYSSAQYGSGSWLFNENGNIYGRIGQTISYMSGTNVIPNLSAEYVIRGAVFVASTVQNLEVTNANGRVKEMNYIRNKKVEITISIGNYAGTGGETLLATLVFDFAVPVTNYVDGVWKYTTFALFLKNSYGTNCYNDMDRIIESGLCVFEWSSDVPYVFNAAQQIFLTIKNVQDKDLSKKVMNMRFLNVATELDLSAKTQFRM